MEPKNKPINDRFQTEQTDTLVEKTEVKTPTSGFDVKPTKAVGSQLKQEVAASVIANKAGATLGGFGDVASRSLPSAYKPGLYTGDNAGIVGSAAGTPMADKPYDGGSRVDKKLSDPNKDINYRASEQYATEMTHVPYLRENKSTVGPNGNPASVSARAQKKTGLVPADPMFDRSLDELRADYFVHLQGQNVGEQGVDYRAYPTKNTIMKDGKWKDVDNSPVFSIGDFSPKYIKTIFSKKNGRAFLKSFEVIEDDYSCMNEDYHTVNASGTNLKIHLNKSEMQRQTIDAKHGSPDMAQYCPLGRSVLQPTQTVTLLRSMEIVTGGITASCLRFANKARAYYLARTGKDGILDKDPAYDALYGHLVNAASGDDLVAITKPDSESEPFMIKDLIARGSAALLLGIFDSPTKYKTKGDIVNQPRGLKLALQTGMNNRAVFKTHPTFLKAINAIDVFSTIDRDYDPSSATCNTQGVRYILPYSWRNALKFTRESADSPRDYTNGSTLFTYRYMAGEGNQRYFVKCGEPILNGIAWFLEQHSASIFKTLGGGKDDADHELIIPVVSYGNYFSLFDLLVSCSMAYIEVERTNTMKDILDLEAWGSYPFDDLVSGKEFVLSPTNYSSLDPSRDISVGRMKPATALQWMFPEHFAPLGRKDLTNVETMLMLPYYFNERDYSITHKSDEAVTFIRNDRHNFSTPIIRSGVRLAFLDDFFGMEAVDVLAATDRLMRNPLNKTNFDGLVYKYGGFTDGQIVLSVSDSAALTYKMVHSTPRLLGWIQPAFAGECIASETRSIDDNMVLSDSDRKIVEGGSSFIARMYKGLPTGDVDRYANMVLGFNGQDVNRGNAFAQKWYSYCGAYNSVKSDSFDILLAASSCFGENYEAIRDKSLFTPFAVYPYAQLDGAVNNPATKVQFAANTKFSVVSLMRGYWARMQKLPFVINPFENTEEGKDTQYVDPFDFAYMLGLAGFLAANYDEELDNRSVEVQDNQFSYDSDPIVEKSPLLN